MCKNENVLNLTDLSATETRELNILAKSIRAECLSVFDSYAEQYKNDFVWWLTPFATRLIDYKVFEQICIVLYTLKKLSTDVEINEVITDNRIIYKVLCDNLTSKESEKIKLTRQVFNIRNFSFLYWINFFRWWVIRLFHYFCLKTVYRNEKLSFDNNFEIVDTYVLSNAFANGNYKDRYYDGLIENSSRKIYFSIIDIAMKKKESFLEVIKQIKETCRNTSYIFIHKPLYLSVFDYFRMLCYPFKILKYLCKPFYYKNIDFSSLKNDVLLRGASCGNSFAGFESYFFIKQLARKKLHLKQFHMWYEGQPCNYGLVAALHKFYPNCLTIGDIGLPLGENDLNFYPTQLEHDLYLSPKVLAFIGTPFINDFKNVCPYQECMLTPAFRNKELFNIETISNKKEKLIVVLGYSIESSSFLLNAIFKILENNKVFSNIEICIKNHPVNKDKNLSDYGINSTFSYKFISGTMIEALSDVKYVVATGTSCGLEILSQNCKLIIYNAPGHLSKNCIPECVSEDIYKIAYDEKDLEGSLVEIVLSNTQNNTVFDKLQYFTPITNSSVSQYFLEK